MRRTLIIMALVTIALACASSGISDERLQAKVQSAISDAFSGTPPLVFVTVRDRVVTLSGQVPSEGDRRKVVDAANTVSGTRAVINQMTIAP
jgi:osmotically-inducible protein OsmY